MKTLSFKLLLFLSLGIIGGCSKEGDDPVDPGSSAETEPNDVTPQPLGTLGASDINFPGSTANANDVDRFSIITTAPLNLHAKVAFGSTADLDIGIQNDDGIMLSFQDTGANPEQCTLANRPAGIYIIEVTSKTGTAVSYTLTIGAR